MGSTTWTNRARVNVIDTDTLLADGGRAAATYDNDANKDLYCNAYLTVQYDTTAPSAGDKMGELYVLPGDDAATEAFPEPDEATDIDPQKIFLVGVFESRRPSITVDEELVIPGIPLYHSGNRFLFKNTSLQQMDATWQLDIVPFTPTTV